MNKVLFKGQSLWEVIIALGVAGLIALGLVKAMVSSIKSSRFSRDQSQMTALAQKKIASKIDEKNKNPTTFWSGLPSQSIDESAEDYCLITTVTDSSLSLPTETPDYATAKMAKVSVDIFWESQTTEKNKCGSKYFLHKLHFETYVTN